MRVLGRLEFQDEESKQLSPMVEGDVGEERRPWQSPRRRAFLCPTALGKKPSFAQKHEYNPMFSVPFIIVINVTFYIQMS